MGWFNFIDFAPNKIGMISKLPFTPLARDVLLDEVRKRSIEIGAPVTGYRVVMDGIGHMELISVCGPVPAEWRA